jgi:hypothetical protein
MIAKAIDRAGDGLIKIRSIEASKEVYSQLFTPLTIRLPLPLLGNQE